MKFPTKLALGSCVVAVGVCGVLAYIAGDDERRDFVRGSTREATVLPFDGLDVDGEVDDEYEDTDDESDRLVVQVQPMPQEPVAAAAQSWPLSGCHRPKTTTCGPETSEHTPQDGKTKSNEVRASDNNAMQVPYIEQSITQ